jgi:predicted DCC family thiol-disulfide oxidoreductase YuxK
MYKLLSAKLFSLLKLQVPATGLGLFRLLFGLVTLQEVLFLLYFNHLIFDPIPYLDVEFPLIHFFLCLWAVIATFIVVGYRYQSSIIANYIFWLVFVNFTPMQRDFDGGFDLFMTGVNLFLIFLPADKALSIDNLRRKLGQSFTYYQQHQQQITVSVLAYSLPVMICLGFLYFDSVIHKMFAPHWRNGLGGWLPATMPYYVSALDMSWLLNLEMVQKIIGYTIIVFQFTFLFFLHLRNLRMVYVLIGMFLHLSIIFTLNIYPFGFGMLICYSLVIPISYYQKIGTWLTAKQPRLTVFYDALCPLCNRTVLILNHFDILHCIEFKAAQNFAKNYPALAAIDEKTLLTDLYALDGKNRLYAGVGTYAQILINMRYPAIVGYLLKMPGIFQIAKHYYRKIADSRVRVSCDESCQIETITVKPTLYDRLFGITDDKLLKKRNRVLTKVVMILCLLQLNSTIHYGLLYRLKVDMKQSPITAALAAASNALILFSGSFAGITPHALYLHDHFQGYNRILAITYLDAQGKEQWLPFINQEGRMLAPNWGRVHSMWANIAVTPKIDNYRLHKLLMRVTAFWGINLGLDLNKTLFQIKMKKVKVSTDWVLDMRNQNLSGAWTTIGTAQWHNKSINIQTPNDINIL